MIATLCEGPWALTAMLALLAGAIAIWNWRRR